MKLNTSNVQHVIDEVIQSERIIGASIVIAQHGEILFNYHIGYADREGKKAVTEETVFRLASMTKPIVSAVALALVEKNILHLDEPITNWLPHFKPKLTNGEIPVITLRHLLTHTSGLSYGFLSSDNEPYYSNGISDGIDETVLSIQENLQRLANVPLLFAPGTAWCYSLSTDVIGAILETVCNQTLPQIVETYVTDPLEMKDTSFYVEEEHRLAKAYADNMGKPARIMLAKDRLLLEGCGFIHYAPGRIRNKEAYASGGAGMAGTALDYLKFLEAIRKGGYPILNENSIALMTKDAVEGYDVPAAGPGFGFGMGFAVVRDSIAANTPRYAGSYEWGGVYGTKMFVDPGVGLSVVVLTNTALEALTGKFPADLTNAIYTDLIPSYNDKLACNE